MEHFKEDMELISDDKLVTGSESLEDERMEVVIVGTSSENDEVITEGITFEDDVSELADEELNCEDDSIEAAIVIEDDGKELITDSSEELNTKDFFLAGVASVV